MPIDIIIAYTAMGISTIMALFAVYQMIKRGFLLWILLIIIGLVGLDFGYAYTQNVPLEAMIQNLTPQALQGLPSRELQNLCDSAGF